MSKRYSNSQNKSTNVRNNYKRNLIRYTTSIVYRIIPLIIENFIKQHFFKPKHYPVSEQEKILLQTGIPFELELHHKILRCWKWGKGPYIILVHGWNGHGSQYLYIIKRLISAGFSVVIFDGPAHGQSEGTHSSYFQMTDAVRRLIYYINSKNILGFIGHSFGASAIINAISKENVTKKNILLAPALNIQKILEDTFVYYGIPIDILYKLISEYEQKFGYSMEQDNPLNILKSIKQELLIIHDVDDTITPYDESKHISLNYNNIQIITTNGLGHKRILIDPWVTDCILDYLEK